MNVVSAGCRGQRLPTLRSANSAGIAMAITTIVPMRANAPSATGPVADDDVACAHERSWIVRLRGVSSAPPRNRGPVVAGLTRRWWMTHSEMSAAAEAVNAEPPDDLRPTASRHADTATITALVAVKPGACRPEPEIAECADVASRRRTVVIVRRRQHEDHAQRDCRRGAPAHTTEASVDGARRVGQRTGERHCCADLRCSTNPASALYWW